MAEKILFADDEARMRRLVRDFLEQAGFEVLEAANGQEAVNLYFANADLACVILDVMMPLMDGWRVCEEIRKEDAAIPIVMLTALSEEKDELKGFRLGVDEYISKPFSPSILVARIQALLRRNRQDGSQHTLEAGGILIDPNAHVVCVDEEEIELSFKEFELLTYFLENEGVALSRERILDAVWDYDYYGDARTIDTHVKKLRSKLGKKGDLIKTVWGMGYKFEVDH